MNKFVRIIGIVILCGLLVLVRIFEDNLFYDPLLDFFKMDYKSMPLPKMNLMALQMGVVFRYVLNTLFSLCILWLWFKDKGVIKVSIFLYLGLFLLFFVVFNLILTTSQESGGHFVLFYVRRFLIQPLFLLILLPAFYFQKYKSS